MSDRIHQNLSAQLCIETWLDLFQNLLKMGAYFQTMVTKMKPPRLEGVAEGGTRGIFIFVLKTDVSSQQFWKTKSILFNLSISMFSNKHHLRRDSSYQPS